MHRIQRARRVRLLLASLVFAGIGAVAGHAAPAHAATAGHPGSATAEVMPPMSAATRSEF